MFLRTFGRRRPPTPIVVDVLFKLQESDTLRQGAYNFSTGTVEDASHDFLVDPAKEHQSRLVATRDCKFFQLRYVLFRKLLATQVP
jgi:hypothetical protein